MRRILVLLLVELYFSMVLNIREEGYHDSPRLLLRICITNQDTSHVIFSIHIQKRKEINYKTVSYF